MWCGTRNCALFLGTKSLQTCTFLSIRTVSKSQIRFHRHKLIYVSPFVLNFYFQVMFSLALPAKETKTSLENITSFFCAYSRLSQLVQIEKKKANYPGTKFVGVAFELRKRMTNSPSCAHVLNKTLNLVISQCLQRTQRNVPKCKTHVQRDCFSSLNLLLCSIVVAIVVVVKGDGVIRNDDF